MCETGPGAGWYMYRHFTIHSYSKLPLIAYSSSSNKKKMTWKRKQKSREKENETNDALCKDIFSSIYRSSQPSVCYFIFLSFFFFSLLLFGKKKLLTRRGWITTITSSARQQYNRKELECGKVWEFEFSYPYFSSLLLACYMYGLICTPAVARTQHRNDFNFYYSYFFP